MTPETAQPVWPSATPPPATAGLRWELTDLAELARVRADLRSRTAALGDPGPTRVDRRDQLVLAFDEMASNALRHAGHGRVVASVDVTDDAYLIRVSDSAPGAPPVPAVGRDPSEGGLGLYLVAEMATDHGWYVRDGDKHVWALLPR